MDYQAEKEKFERRIKTFLDEMLQSEKITREEYEQVMANT